MWGFPHRFTVSWGFSHRFAVSCGVLSPFRRLMRGYLTVSQTDGRVGEQLRAHQAEVDVDVVCGRLLW